jgi:hypothetical protein
MSINGIQNSRVGFSSYSHDFSGLSAAPPASPSGISLEDGIDSLKRGSDFDQLILSKGSGKQSTTVTCPEGTTPVATQDGQSMTITCEKPVNKKGDATNKPSQAPVID